MTRSARRSTSEAGYDGHATEMRPRPVEPIEGKKVAVFTTAGKVPTSDSAAPDRGARRGGRPRFGNLADE